MGFDIQIYKRLATSLKNRDSSTFLHNYFIQENLNFSRDRRALKDLLDDFVEPMDLYFSSPLYVLDDAITLKNFYSVGLAHSDLNGGGFFLEKNKFRGFVLNYNSVSSRLMEFYDGLISLASIYSNQLGVSQLDLLGDSNSLRKIHNSISSPERFKSLNDDYWNLFTSFASLVPSNVSNYNSFFNSLKLVIKNDYVISDSESFFNNNPKIVNISLDILKSPKLDFSNESADLFKEAYHDRLVDFKLKNFF